ncbi:MAG: hypothetical protein ACLFQJ_03105 [Campylobacterales bacterium]
MPEDLTNERDFDKELEEKTLELKKCQEQKSITSCLSCSEALGCEVRNGYVKAVYFSMSKGDTGDFEF